MRSSRVYDILSHHEDGSGLRHPLVALSQPPIAIVMLIAFFFSDRNPGQTIYFLVAIGLYVSSTFQHALRPNWWVNFIDQTAIGWYVASVHLPFTYHEWWAIPLFLAQAFLVVLIKGRGLESTTGVSNLVFLSMGAVSFAIMLTFGLPAIGVGLWEFEARLVYLATAFFLLTLLIFHYQWPNPVPNLLGPPELKHFCLALAVGTFSFLVVGNQV